MPDSSSNGSNGNHSIEGQPAYGTRGSEPGPRGCWAVKADGTPCGAARRRDGDFCTAHSGLGVAADPAAFGAIGTKASAEARTRRAELRASLGITRPNTIRGTLRAHAFVERERIARAAIAPIHGDDPVAAHRAALAILDAVEPAERVELAVSLPADEAGISALSLRELELLESRGALGT